MVAGQHVNLFALCPPAKCGSKKRVKPHIELRFRTNEYSIRNGLIGRQNIENEPTLGIVGGVQCQPEQWPYIVGIYRDGLYHCGGVIYDKFWVRQNSF